jgi:hypothetical protein
MQILPRLRVILLILFVLISVTGCLSFEQSQDIRNDFAPFEVKIPKNEVISRDVNRDLLRQYEDMDRRGLIRH